MNASITQMIKTTAEDFRPMFEAFKNLNLITLINNLTANRVGRLYWRQANLDGTIFMCPMMHSVPNETHISRREIAYDLGVPYTTVDRFVHWWDSPFYHQQNLLHLLTSIWEERVAEAYRQQMLSDDWDKQLKEEYPVLVAPCKQLAESIS